MMLHFDEFWENQPSGSNPYERVPGSIIFMIQYILSNFMYFDSNNFLANRPNHILESMYE